MSKSAKSQDQKQRFIDAARQLGADEDPEAFKERLKKLVKAPPPASATRRKKDKPHDE